MKQIISIGDTKLFEHEVVEEDVAKFETGLVHHVYSTFALTRDAEWTCRLFVLDMLEPHEEGIGTFVNVQHKSPALMGSKVIFKATVTRMKRNEIVCTFVARVKDRLIAEGMTGQKIICKEKLTSIFNSIQE